MGRDLARLRFVEGQITEIDRLERAAPGPDREVAFYGAAFGTDHLGWRRDGGHARREVLSGNLRDRRAVARYAGLTGAPDESGSKRREKGLAKPGNSRVPRGMIQLDVFSRNSWARPASFAGRGYFREVARGAEVSPGEIYRRWQELRAAASGVTTFR
jgi:hypothetical protein